MPTDCISYQKSGYFAKLIVDYLDEKSELKTLYNRFPKLENFKAQIDEKTQNFPQQNRDVLVAALQNQYKGFEVSEATNNNISLLSDAKTFTITTGHQLNLFTGPLYFLYKIVSTINLCSTLKKEYPEYNFVPVYWMATEDHDFEEINYFNFKNIKIKWNAESHGPVGRLSTSGLEEVAAVFASELGIGQNADYLKKLFEETYLKHGNLADATRFLANELFGKKGLVILDGDDTDLKQLFAPYVKNELLNQTSFKKVSETNSVIEKEYQIQVNPREINLFYIEDNLRERILFEDNLFKINNTKLAFSEKEIMELLENNPEKFSPNVILRPLYEEIILPNLCYIGGGGEISYWLQLKSNFEANRITFPILLIRNSVVLATEKQFQKADKLELSWADLFSNQQELFNNKTKEFSKFNLDFSEQKEFLKQQFEKLQEIAKQTDKSFLGAVNAQQTKQIKGLDNLEKRLLKAEKRVHAEKLELILLLQNQLFPNQGLQERKANFSEFYLDASTTLIEKLLQQLDPLEPNFTIVSL
ncbi:bacillithiol biosynthesis cysteine-adding enzyme BshC [Flavobacterium wongokense]|uniref:bacillithiol biosynthesis cysteine-adding enzyme BshC n=1 Tax=Flavobacterium wongokense TaxID=2910674 RepID=UPI001F27217A|nr:bacillithiol biosynthesis cysteine-adding enzyme BshC [Flavobacterium sp. WG47]MCF6133526.1 bacillithiol biosynthesis cysteine-adding enzyme BshC [Flavobacterium sp. WG47]